MILSSYAKINLGLKVNNKRADGFHDVDMVVQSVDLCDLVYLSKLKSKEILVSCDKNICDNNQNLAYKAAKIIIEKYNLDFGLNIHIDKNIPIGAGLGGGSSNAAAVIFGLNTVLHLSRKEIIDIALKIGSDVPFCVFGGTLRCQGRGEILSNIDNPREYKVLIRPGSNFSFTSNAYEKLDSFFDKNNTERTDNFRISKLINSLKYENIEKISECCFNDFEHVIDFPRGWHLTGSGSASFKIVNKNFTKNNDNIIICKPINCGVRIIEDNWN